MKANELRIGNLVLIEDKVLKVESVESILVDTGSNYEPRTFYGVNKTFFQEYLKPIPLTEEWLIKFGFKKRGVEWWNKCEDCDGICLEQYVNGVFYSAGEGIRLSIDVKYVHQLQNLYFALTGVELKYIE